jgi:hypothetical protein
VPAAQEPVERRQFAGDVGHEAEVGAGAEAAAGPRQHDCPDLVVLVDLGEVLLQ